VVAIGFSPSASTMSCSVRPTTAMRRGLAGTVVVPRRCVTVTGKTLDPVAGARPPSAVRIR
jgi:hypothetical protein